MLRRAPSLLVFLFLCCAFAFAQASNPVPSDGEIMAIKDLMGSISGWPPTWNISDTQNVCQWTGITCKVEIDSAYITHIELPAQKLQGSFPDTIGNLTFLEILDLPNQGLYGTLPPSLFKLQELTAVKLNWNYLSGPLPEEVPPKLVEFSARTNGFNGTLPEAYANLPSLQFLSLENNNLECPLSLSWVQRFANHEGLLGCYLWENQFFMQDNKVCGTIPQHSRPNKCSVWPVKEPLSDPPALTDTPPQRSIEYDGIYLEVSDDNRIHMFIRQPNGQLFKDQYALFGFLGAVQEGYFTLFKSYAPSFEELGPGDYSLDGEFSDGMTIKVQFNFTNAAEGAHFKLGWTLRNHHFPGSEKFRIILQFAIRQPFEETRPFGCPTTPVQDGLDEIFNSGGPPEVWLSNCRSSHANVSSRIHMETAQPMAEFIYASPEMKSVFDWAATVEADGKSQFVRISTASVYIRERNMDAAVLGRARELGIPIDEPPVAPLDQQYLNVIMHMDYPLFTDKIYYDPDIHLQLLFFDDQTDMSWIAAPIVGAVVVVAAIALVAIYLNPTARAKVFPFVKRGHSKTTQYESTERLTSEASAQGGDWASAKTKGTTLHNVKKQ